MLPARCPCTSAPCAWHASSITIEPAALGDVHDRIHVGRLSVQVHGDDRLGLRRDRGLEPGRSIVNVSGSMSTNTGVAPRVVDGRHGGHERERHGDDLVAAAHAGGEQREMQRARAAVDADAVLRLAVGGELLVERRDFTPERERARVEDALDGGVHLGLDTGVLGLQIDERNHTRFS